MSDMPRPKIGDRITIRLPEPEARMLEDLMAWTGVREKSTLVRHCIIGMHILIKVGLPDVMKSLPELAKLVLKKEKGEEYVKAWERYGEGRKED